MMQRKPLIEVTLYDQMADLALLVYANYMSLFEVWKRLKENLDD